jgi:hypothetical protein
MSYCRFENTLADLQDCYNSLLEDNPDDLSESEKEARLDLITLCKDIAEGFDK